MSIVESIASILDMKYHKENPLVCFITNHVTELDLVEYAKVDAVMMNTGTINREYLDIMVNTGKQANAHKVPVILDPAAISASSFRLNAFQRILDEVDIDIIKGNLGEIKSILGYEAKSKGIDSFEEESDAEKYCIELAEKRKCITVMTGKEDIITDGKRMVKIQNGNPRLKLICGAGSTIGSLISVFAGYSKDYFLSSVLGVAMMGIAGEIAEHRLKEGEGNRTFKQYLHDAISLISSEDIVKYARITEI